jgi:hypothetical protein
MEQARSLATLAGFSTVATVLGDLSVRVQRINAMSETLLAAMLEDRE